MHNVNTEALNQTIAKAQQDPGALNQHVSFDGEWQTQQGQPQFRTTIAVPNGEPFVFEADFPPPMGGTGSAPNPLAYCFWGGLACYAMTYAQEAARQGIELRSLRARTEADVDMTRALGVTDNPPSDASTGTSKSTPTPPARSSTRSNASPTSTAQASTAYATPYSSPPTSKATEAGNDALIEIWALPDHDPRRRRLQLRLVAAEPAIGRQTGSRRCRDAGAARRGATNWRYCRIAAAIATLPNEWRQIPSVGFRADDVVTPGRCKADGEPSNRSHE